MKLPKQLPRQLKPSLTWFFSIIAIVLMGGFAWLEFHQHAKAIPAADNKVAWQPPKPVARQSISIKAPSRPAKKAVKMPTTQRQTKSLAQSMPAPKDEPPARNYDDIPEPEEQAETTFEVGEDPGEDVEKLTPEKLIMKGFSPELMKVPENLEQEFAELSEEQGELGKDKDKKAEKSTDGSQPAEGTQPASGDAPDAEPAAEPGAEPTQPEGQQQDAGDGSESGAIDPSTQRPPEEEEE